MPKFLLSKLFLVTFMLSGVAWLTIRSFQQHTVDFSTSVKPLLNRKCITCHGGVRKQGGFSLLFREDALGKTKSGKPAIVPGDPDHSEMIRRLTLKDPEERMPYKHDPLTPGEIELLSNWVKQGAQWGEHWSYQPLVAVTVPKPPRRWFGLLPAANNPWVRTDIDNFILDKLVGTGLTPAPTADKATLLRRVSLDLTGMLPTAGLAERYMASNDESAYATLVDSLLASPHFGERFTSVWLDLARYADTKGYERDDARSIWRYRDWLIKAFNADMPYDKFISEQIAGDLLPNPADDDYIATAFHRNTMTNDEGGTDNEEFRTAAVLDRVNTTWEALMGTSFACVQCHSHPYDPFRHEDYYKFAAYFNNTRDEDTEADYPLLRTFNDSLMLKLNELRGWLNRYAPARTAPVTRFIRTWQPAINSLTAEGFINSELTDTKWLVLRNHAVAIFNNVDLDGTDQLIMRYSAGLAGGLLEFHIDSTKGNLMLRITVPVTKGWDFLSAAFPRQAGNHRLFLTYSNPALKKPGDNGIQFDWLHFTNHFPGEGMPGYEAAYKLFNDLVRVKVPVTPVMMENPAGMRRVTQVFEKGNWLVKGAVVSPAVPAIFKTAMPANAPFNRLGLSQWLVDKKNPLVARTIVNRMWEQLFGTGIVETLEDMGSQGMAPTHRELLDYLAYQLMTKDQWSLKKLLRSIVMSATYREDSQISTDAIKADPQNRLLARGCRVRLSAEQLRDQALCASGALNPQLFGPSVFPYQPAGIWLSPWNGTDWKPNSTGQQYRRSLYTYWKRTAPYPSMISFDGVAREVCTARRIRTNTPLQALVTLNDSVYVDLARHLATAMQLSGSDVRTRIANGYQRVLLKQPGNHTLEILTKLYETARRRFNEDQHSAELIALGKKRDGDNAAPDAALIVVANAILNLDEVINKN